MAETPAQTPPLNMALAESVAKGWLLACSMTLADADRFKTPMARDIIKAALNA